MPTGANIKVVQFTLFSQSHLTFAFEITEINFMWLQIIDTHSTCTWNIGTNQSSNLRQRKYLHVYFFVYISY
jgi:hypothetical protein